LPTAQSTLPAAAAYHGGDPIGGTSARGQSIAIVNHALMMVHEGNEYVNIAVEIHCTIQTDPRSKRGRQSRK
jgi:hypothetical protein